MMETVYETDAIIDIHNRDSDSSKATMDSKNSLHR